MEKTETASEYQAGQIVYLPDGRKATFVSSLPDGVLVRSYLSVEGGGYGEYYDDNYEYPGALEMVQQVFLKAPVAIYDKEMEALDAKLEEKRKQLDSIRSDILEAGKNRAAVLSKLKQVAALYHIEEFIDGKITHFVVEKYNRVSVLTREQALKPDEYDREQKLLTLYGRTKGELQWGINHYSDGSGNGYTEAWPFLSEADAIEFAKSRLQQQASAADAKTHSSTLENLSKSFSAMGLAVPDNLKSLLTASQHASVDSQLAHYTKLLTELQAKKAQLAKPEMPQLKAEASP